VVFPCLVACVTLFSFSFPRLCLVSIASFLCPCPRGNLLTKTIISSLAWRRGGLPLGELFLCFCAKRPIQSAPSLVRSSYGANAFFRKSNRYQFEREWRGVKALYRLSQEQPNGGLPIYLAPFSPKCIGEILIRHSCSIEWELRALVTVDTRYRHVPVNFVEELRNFE
jgi:hypothetical protein